MIAVDTSALMAILLREPEAERCKSILATETELVISAGTIAEALIVAGRRKVGEEMAGLIDGLRFDVSPVNLPAARRIGVAYARWGRGYHPAGLNFGDLFSYEVAAVRACPLLFVGADFSKTDLVSAAD